MWKRALTLSYRLHMQRQRTNNHMMAQVEIECMIVLPEVTRKNKILQVISKKI
jgi:hypothetical protein